MNLTAIQGNIVSMRGNLLAMDARQPLIIEVDTTKGNGFNSFTLPLTNHTTDIYVKVSDGQRFTISNYLDTKRTIAFASAGVYTAELRGQCGWSFNNTGDCQKLTRITSWGDFLFNYLVGGFFGCVNIGLNEGLPTKGGIYAPNVTSLHLAFAVCSLSRVDVELLQFCTNVTIASSTFATNFITNIPDGFLHKMTKINSIYGIFYNNRLTNLKSDLLTHNLLLVTVEQAFAYNRITTIGENLFYENKLIISYYGTFSEAFYPNCILPTVMFDLTQMHKVFTFNHLFSCSEAVNTPTGTVQDIWNYAATTSTIRCFHNCTGLTNYDDIPTEWI